MAPVTISVLAIPLCPDRPSNAPTTAASPRGRECRTRRLGGELLSGQQARPPPTPAPHPGRGHRRPRSGGPGTPPPRPCQILGGSSSRRGSPGPRGRPPSAQAQHGTVGNLCRLQGGVHLQRTAIGGDQLSRPGLCARPVVEHRITSEGADRSFPGGQDEIHRRAHRPE